MLPGSVGDHPDTQLAQQNLVDLRAARDAGVAG